jgi:hypothetical protein
MADSPAFEFVCNELERVTKLSRLEARGTVRLALKEAGLAANAVRPMEMQVVLKTLLPRELAARGITTPEQLCREIGDGVSRLREEGSSQTPEAIFSRLAGGS